MLSDFAHVNQREMIEEIHSGDILTKITIELIYLLDIC